MADEKNPTDPNAGAGAESAAALLQKQQEQTAAEKIANNGADANANDKAKPAAENLEDDVFFVDENEETEAGKKPESGTSAFDRKRWKELDDDIDVDNFDEEKVFSRARQYKDKFNKAAILAQASELIENDEPTQTIKSFLGKADEDLVLENEIQELKNLGYKDDDAATEAAKTLAEYKEESPSYIAKQARKLRIGLTGALNARKELIQSKIAESRKALSLSEAPNPELIQRSIEELGKTKTFLGLPIGSKTEQGMKDFMKPVGESIKNGTLLKKLQSDPGLLAKAGLLLEYGDRFEKEIVKRKLNAKTKAKNDLQDAPYSAGKRITQPKVDFDEDGKPKLKSPGTFS